jgi:hypothetical protein
MVETDRLPLKCECGVSRFVSSLLIMIFTKRKNAYQNFSASRVAITAIVFEYTSALFHSCNAE